MYILVKNIYTFVAYLLPIKCEKIFLLIGYSSSIISLHRNFYYFRF